MTPAASNPFLKNDIVSLDLKNLVDLEKLLAFNKKYNTNYFNYVQQYKNSIVTTDYDPTKRLEFKIREADIFETPKKTKYLKILVAVNKQNSFYCFAQLRFVKLKYRKNKHPLTRIFMPDI